MVDIVGVFGSGRPVFTAFQSSVCQTMTIEKEKSYSFYMS